jgi:hypothetical protein
MAVTWKKLAFYDEVALVSSEVAHDVGTTASAGVATDAARHDHVHRLANGSVDVAAVLASDVVETLKIKDANVTTAKLSIDANLNMNKKQLTAAALDNQTSNPATPVLGQIYFHAGAGELHPYICTVIA